MYGLFDATFTESDTGNYVIEKHTDPGLVGHGGRKIDVGHPCRGVKTPRPLTIRQEYDPNSARISR